jgi:hypothetical protein
MFSSYTILKNPSKKLPGGSLRKTIVLSESRRVERFNSKKVVGRVFKEALNFYHHLP